MYDPSTVLAAGLILAGIVIAIIRSDPSASDPPTRAETDEDRDIFTA